MRRLVLTTAIAIALVAPVASAEGTLEDAFATLSVGIQAGLDGVPNPPVTKEDKKALKAWTKADKTADKALAKPSPKGFTKAAKKIDKGLTKAFPEDPTVTSLLVAFSGDVVSGSQAELDSLRQSILDMPPGDNQDFLLGLLPEVEALVDQAEAAETPSEAHNLCAQVAVILGAIEKKFNRVFGKCAMTAVVDETRVDLPFVEGSLNTAGGGVKALGIAGVKFDGTNSETIYLGINLTGVEGFIVPGQYAILPEGPGEGGYTRGNTMGFQQIINGESGTITIVSINAATGEVKGFFEFSGPNISEGISNVTSGVFCAKGLIVTPLEE